MVLSLKLLSGTACAAQLVLTLFVWPMFGASVTGTGDSSGLRLGRRVSRQASHFGAGSSGSAAPVTTGCPSVWTVWHTRIGLDGWGGSPQLLRASSTVCAPIKSGEMAI